MSDHVLSRNSPDPQAVRLLLKCLNHLRSRQLDALERAKPPSDGTEDVTLWRKVQTAARSFRSIVLVKALGGGAFTRPDVMLIAAPLPCCRCTGWIWTICRWRKQLCRYACMYLMRVVMSVDVELLHYGLCCRFMA